MSTAPAITAFALESSGPAASALANGQTLTLQAGPAWETLVSGSATVSSLGKASDLPAHTVRVPRGPAALTLTF
jgi:hypothetical protein